EEQFCFLDQSFGKHLRGAVVDAGIECFPLGIEATAQDAESLQRFAAMQPKFSHWAPRGEAYLDRSNHFGNVVGVNAARCRRIKPLQDAMQVLRSVLRNAAAQFAT